MITKTQTTKKIKPMKITQENIDKSKQKLSDKLIETNFD